MKTIIFIVLSIFFIHLGLHAEKAGVVNFISKNGTLYHYAKEDQSDIKELKVKDTVHFEKKIKSEKAVAEIGLHYLDQKSKIVIQPNTEIKITRKINKKKASGIFLAAGRLWSLIRGKKTMYKVETFNSAAGVEGTEFEMRVEDGKTILFVFDGIVKLTAKPIKKIKLLIPRFNIRKVKKGQIAIVHANNKIEMLKSGESTKYSDEFQKAEKLYQQFKSSENTQLKKAAIEDKEIEEEISDDLETFGESTVRIKFSGVTVPFDIKINDCSMLNGKKLVYQNNRPFMLEGLDENEEYILTITASGISSDFTLTPEKNSQMIEIGFRNIYIGVRPDINSHLYKYTICKTNSDPQLPGKFIHKYVTLIINKIKVPLILDIAKRSPYNAYMRDVQIQLAITKISEKYDIYFKDDQENKSLVRKLEYYEGNNTNHYVKIIIEK
ncbi:FecR domain-containing protein [bacterium]|nr:FecR domain-containing protein [bacterium]